MKFFVASLLALSLAALVPARAGNPPAQVGRVSFVSGQVGWQPSGAEWRDAAINDPVAAGMSVRTDAGGEAVLRIGAMAIGLAGGTRLDIAQLDPQVTHLTVPQGRIELSVPRLGDDQKVEIDIPRGGVWLLRPGRYDIAAGSAQEGARVAVFAGGARFVGAHLDTAIGSGKTAVLSGSDPVKATTEAAAADTFADWCQSRAVDDSKLDALRYVSHAMTGYEALDAHGRWTTDSKEGPLWFPSGLPADWAPYRDGHWSWVEPWGWTWIDDQDWGFAPSHYGRWMRIDGEWGWAPGGRVAHPVYAPALVAFIGTPAVGLSYAGGSGPAVAWFPLAPGEVYWPSYTQDLGLIRRLNAGAAADPGSIGSGSDATVPVVLATGHFANREFASVVPRSIFVGGKPVAPALLSLPSRRLAVAPLVMGSPRIPPAAPRAIAIAAPRRPAPPIRTASAHAGPARLHAGRLVPAAGMIHRPILPVRRVALRPWFLHRPILRSPVMHRRFVGKRSAHAGAIRALFRFDHARIARRAYGLRYRRQHFAANLSSGALR